ncbi:DUF427 domain-containing protein [Acuticoccus sediminis]|nr:DUF427 domain-containing protein [Acuticoccus sediminis]
MWATELRTRGASNLLISPAISTEVDPVERSIRVPDSDYPISIERSEDDVMVIALGQMIAETRRSLEVREGRGRQPAIRYIPMADVDMSLLRPSATLVYCPYKGDASLFTLFANERDLPNAAWCYRAPHWAVAELEGHVAFAPSKVERIAIRPAGGGGVEWT